jgi:integrase
MYDVLKQPIAKKFLSAIARSSKNSATSYAVALSHFSDFLETKHETLETIIKALLSGKQDVYDLLDDFLTFIISEGNRNDKGKTISNLSIKAYLAGIRSFVQYNKIDIVPYKFKHQVKMPKVARQDEEAIDAPDIREILLHTTNKRLKPYMLILASAGPRTIEVASLRLGELELDDNKINIRKEFTKTKQARYSFISDEAVKFLKEWIAWKYRSRGKYKKTPIQNDTDLVFGSSKETEPRHIYQRLRIEFNKVLSAINKDKRKEGVQRRKITLNSFRRFVKSVVAEQASTDYSEWLIGHAKSSYWVKKPEEKGQIYATKCMKYLTFLDYTVLEATGKNIEAKLSEKEKEIQLLRQRDQMKDQEMQSMKEQIQTIEQSHRQSFEEFKVENHRIIKEAMAKFKATLSPKALESFSHKSIIEVLEE